MNRSKKLRRMVELMDLMNGYGLNFTNETLELIDQLYAQIESEWLSPHQPEE